MTDIVARNVINQSIEVCIRVVLELACLDLDWQ